MSTASPPARVTLFSIPFHKPHGRRGSRAPRKEPGPDDLHASQDAPQPDESWRCRLDFYSGLFLLLGATDLDWLLEARTWGDPPASLVHDWHIRAAFAARQVDPTVEPSPRRPTDRRVGI